MKIRTLGKSGVEVSALGPGCMGMSFAYGTPAIADASVKRQPVATHDMAR